MKKNTSTQHVKKYINNFPSALNDFTFASENKTTSRYWANPRITLLNKDWWLVLNDISNGRLHVFRIPKGQQKTLKVRTDKPNLFNLKIDHTFKDLVSGTDFSRWHELTIKY